MTPPKVFDWVCMVLLGMAIIATFRVIRSLIKVDPVQRNLNKLGWLITIVMLLTTINCIVYVYGGWSIFESQPAEVMFVVRTLVITAVGIFFDRFLKDYKEKKGDEKLLDEQTKPH